MFNLASQYASSGLFSEALSTYQQLIKNRSYANIGRLRLNIANLHFGLGQYALALKQYRMALDQVPAHFTTLRYASTHHSIWKRITKTALNTTVFQD